MEGADGIAVNHTSDFRPKFPDFTDCEKRLASFKTWPKYLRPCPQALANSGFVYTGKSDLVYCFACGITIKDWEPSDNPWTEHFRHSVLCFYARMCQVCPKECANKHDWQGNKSLDVIDSLRQK